MLIFCCCCGLNFRASNSNGVPTKENQALENAILCCGPRRMSEKFCSSSSSLRRSRSRGLPYDIRRKPCHGYNSTIRGRTHFGSPTSSCLTTVHCSAHLEHELKSKTEKFPVPVLFRSKSLEDLRDTSSSSSSSSLNSQGLQHHSNNNYNANNFIDFGPRGLNLCTTNINIKKEIDSMSMRIEKLDVA